MMRLNPRVKDTAGMTVMRSIIVEAVKIKSRMQVLQNQEITVSKRATNAEIRMVRIKTKQQITISQKF